MKATVAASRVTLVGRSRLAGLLACLVLLSGCSACNIKTTPGGAQVYLDGELVGTSPCRVSVGGVFTSHHNIKVEKEGYQTAHSSLVSFRQRCVN